MAENVLRFDFLARDRASGTFDKLARKSDDLGGRMSKFGRVAGLALKGTAVAAGGLAAAGTVMGVKTAAGLEQAQVGFTTLLGSGKKAQTFLVGLKRFAATTPFELPGLVESSRTLLGVGVSAKDAMKIMRDFGDTAGAVGIGQEQFQRIMIATSQAIGAGRFMTADLNQIMNNGIPIWTILSKAMGKPIPVLKEMASEGKLLSKDVLPVLQAQMHKDYGGSMAKQSKTLNGLWSTFMDTLNIGLADAIGPMIPALKTGLAGATRIAGTALEKLPGIVTIVSGKFSTIKNFVTTRFTPALAGTGEVIRGIGEAAGTAAGRVRGFLKQIGVIKPPKSKPENPRQADWFDAGQSKDWAATLGANIKAALDNIDWKSLGGSIGKGLATAIGSVSGMGSKLAGAVLRWAGEVNWIEVGKTAGLAAGPFAIGFVNEVVTGLINAAIEHPMDVAKLALFLVPLGKFTAAFKPVRNVIEKLPLGKWFTGLMDKTAVPIFDGVAKVVGWLGQGFARGFRDVFPTVGKGLFGRLRRLADGIGARALYFGDKGRDLIIGLGSGIAKAISHPVRAVGRVIVAISRPFVRAGGWLVGKGRAFVGGLREGIAERARDIGGFLKSRVIDRITGRFANAGNWLKLSGRRLLAGLHAGMVEKVQDAGRWIKSIGGTIVRAVKNFFGIKSPSTVFAGMGKNLVAGLFKGMIQSNPTKTIGKIFGSMPKALGALIDKGLVSITSLPGKALNALQGLGGKFANLLDGFGTGGGRGGGTTGGLIAFGKWLQSMGYSVTEHPAFGGVGTHSRGSLHYSGQAIDVNAGAGTSAAEQSRLAKIIGPAHQAGFRTIFMAPGHYNHAHVSLFGGGVIPEEVFGVGRSGRTYSFGEKGPETVIPGQRRGGGGTTINVTINAPVGSHPREIGRELVRYIRAYERSN